MRYFMGCVIGILSVFSAFAAMPSKVDIYTEHFPLIKPSSKTAPLLATPPI